MTYVMTDGLLGIEGVWTWFPPQPWAPSVVLNEMDIFPPNTRLRIVDVTGLFAAVDAEDNRRKRLPVGERRLPSDMLGKTITLEVLVEAVTVRDLRRGVNALGKAFAADLDNLGFMQIVPHEEYAEEDSPYWEARPRAIAFDAAAEPDYDQHRVWPLQQRVTIGLRLLDPRWRWNDLVAGGTSGGAGPVDITNPGNAPTDPQIIQTVASTAAESTTYEIALGPYIDGFAYPTHTLRIDAPAHGAGAIWWTFGDDPVNELPARSVIFDPFASAVDLTPYLNVQHSNLWDRGQVAITPGGNRVSQTGGTGLEVAFYPMSYL